LSAIPGVTPSLRTGTYFAARDYDADDIERADREWAAKAADFQAARPDAADVRIERSAVWQKPTYEERMAQIDHADRKNAADFPFYAMPR
jgi:nucleoside 2-deoxyribosyltransferase